MSLISSYIKYLGRKAEEEIEKNIQRLLAVQPADTYLDCGCFDGVKTFSRASMLQAKKVIGTEILADLAKSARLRGVEVLQCDLNLKWPLESKSIDLVTATEVVEHLHDLDNFFLETHRVLKSKGFIVISTENLASWHNIAALIMGMQPYTGPYLSRKFKIGHHPNDKYRSGDLSSRMPPHINVMTQVALEELLKKFGFVIEKKINIGFYPLMPPFSRLMCKVDPRHSSYVLIKAKKDS